MLFEISTVQSRSLDKAEGAGYARCDTFPVRRDDDGELVRIRCYLASKSKNDRKPYDWYLALIIAGAREHGLTEEYIARVSDVEFAIDHVADRNQRRVALRALEQSGFADYKSLLVAGTSLGPPTQDVLER